MPSTKAVLSLQVFAALGLVVLAGLWLFFHLTVARYLLGAVLTLGTFAVLAYCGIFSGKSVDQNAMDRNTQALALFTLVVAILFALFSKDLVGILGVWILVISLFTAFLAVIGVFVSGRAMGLLINSKNRMSLSTFQTILWTVVLLSAFFTVAAALMQTATQGKKLCLGDCALHPEQEPVVGIARIVDRCLVGQERAGDHADFDQPVPIDGRTG